MIYYSKIMLIHKFKNFQINHIFTKFTVSKLDSFFQQKHLKCLIQLCE